MVLPTITAPTSISVDEDSGAFTLTGVSVADADGDTLTLTISAEGLLAFSVVTGLTFTVGDGSSANTMTFSGSVADINAALATLTYAPASNDDDGDSIAISVTDGTQGVSGPGTFAATFELSSLLAANGGDGSTGFVLNGIDAGDESGLSVSSAGDVNGDGIDDLIIGAHLADPNGNSGAGESYVVFGSSAGFGASFELSSLASGDGSTGFVLNGIGSGDQSGRSVSSAGDVNGDGIDDLIIGAYSGDPNGNNAAGETYVVFGSSAGFGASFELSTLASGDGSTGFVLNGIDAGDQSGRSVSSAGDVNGDGIDDLIIGAPSADPNGNSFAGESYVVFGSSAGFGASFDLSALASGDGSTGFVLNGIDAGDGNGFSVSSVGDVNGDGVDDLIVGAAGGDPNGNTSAGETYVVFGSSAGFGASFDLSALASGDGSTGFVLNGIDGSDLSGRSVSSAGDVNGDGIDDLIIGAYVGDPNGYNSGESYVVFGSSAGFGASFELSTLASGDGSTGFVLNGIDAYDRSGRSVSSAGDVNGDGIDDLIIGADGGDPNGSSSGESYVVFGSSAGFGASFDLSSLASGDGSTGFVLNGIDASDQGGRSVSSAGDVNGDGIDDLIIGVFGGDPNGSSSGESYVVFGRVDFSDVLVNGALTVNITPENDAPTIGGDQAITVLEGGSIVLTVTDFIGTDIEDDDATLTYAVSNLVAGSVQIGGIDVATFTAAQLAAGDVSFVHDGSENAGAFDVTAVDDDGLSSAAITIAATVTPVNDLPTISIPAAITVAEDSSAALVAGLSVADAEDDILTVTLSAEGDLALGVLTGLTFITGDGSSANTMTFSGSVADINAALAMLTYAPASNDDDGDSIAISVTDGTQIVTPGTFAATFELSSLLAANGGDGSTGFVLNGIDADDRSGRSVSSAGDVNGDGIDDLVIGAYGGDPNGSYSGESYVVFGSSAGFGASFELSTLASGDGSTGFVLNGIGFADRSGRSVSSAGDVNGDGIDDLIIGADRGDPNGNSAAGESYVVFGSSAGFGASIDLSTLASGDGSTGFVLNGIDSNDFSGSSVSSAGDVNGDGIDDLIIGAFGGDPNGSSSGESYVVFGSSAGFGASFDLSSLASGDGSTGFVINGIDADDRSGRSVSSAGDVNGDGIDDLIIGARYADPNGSYSGESYVVFGSSAGFGASFELSTLASGDGSTGFVLNGIDAFDQSGRSVSSAGDVNGDGIDDLIIGAHLADPNGNTSAGESYVVFGSSAGFGASLEPSTLASGDGSTGFVLNGIDPFDQSGISVSSAGDVNGDGIDDLIIGARYADPNGKGDAGESYVVFGSSAGFGASFDLSSLASGDGSTGFVINGIDAGDFSGRSVSSAGDVNGDGIDDLIIGAYSGDPNGSYSGESYVVFGRADFSDVLVNGALTVNITPENDAPTIAGDLAFEVREGGRVTLTAADFLATDVDHDDATLQFFVQSPVTGSLQVGDVVVSSFSAQQLANGEVSFVHDGSQASTGSFDVVAYDAAFGFSQPVTVTATVDYAPTLSGDQSITVTEGGFVVLSSDDFIGADIDDDSAVLVYSITNLFAGIIEIDGAEVTTFTHAQLLNGDVRFVHDGSEDAGAFDVSVSDDGLPIAVLATLTVAATVIPVNDAPVLSGDLSIRLSENGSVALTVADVLGTDVDNNDAGLNYLVQNVIGGTLQISGANVSSFTGAQLVNGDVQFVHDGIAAAGSFDIIVLDTNFSVSQPATVNVGINFRPTIAGDQEIAVLEGGSFVLTAADFVGTDADDDDAGLTYTVSNFVAGAVQVSGVSVTTFTGAQLLAGDVNFVHDGSETLSGAFDVSVADDEGLISAALAIAVTVTAENDAPVLSGDFAGSLNDGGAYVLMAADLSASDVDDATSVLVFTVSNVVNGTVLLNGTATQTFTLADIDAGLVSFRHDASATADGSFEVTVADDDGAASAASTFTLTALGPVVQDGTSGVDDLDGTDANDFIRGLDSNDRIDGFDGNDQLFGNEGSDTLLGGNGDDILNGGNGDDRLFGGAGADFMDGRGGFDLASYKTATSGIVLDLTNGANNTGDAAGDTFANIAAFEGTRFNDTMTGDDNTNRMFGLDGEDTLNGGGANDRLLGGDGNDTLNGDDGADLLYGDDGDDILNGGNGRDVLVGGDGADTFNGGADIDRVTYKPSDSGVTIDLTNAANSTGDALGDTFNSIELVEGSQFDDIFIGTDLRDRLFGLDGVDQITAGAGNDLLEGGNGNDVLDGGADADILRGGADNDTLTGGTGKDRFQFGANGGADTITDFSQSELDRMQFTDASGVESMADLTIVQQGNDTLITYAQGSILLEDITATDLAAADFSFL